MAGPSVASTSRRKIHRPRTRKREISVIGHGGRVLRLAEFVEVMEELGEMASMKD